MHSDNHPFAAAQSGALIRGTVESRATHSGQIGRSGNMSSRDACDLCGSQTWEGDAHFAMGKLWCPECWAGREPAAAMPPTRLEQLLLEQWIAPLNRGARP
jgi:hypothetical protein